MKHKKIIAFILLFDLLVFLSFVINWKPLCKGELESLSKHIYTYFYTYISWSDRFCEQNNIEQNTIFDGVYVIYINKRNTSKSYEQINYDCSFDDLANHLNKFCSCDSYGYYCILDVNSSEITNIYTTTEKLTVNKILNNRNISSFESVGVYPSYKYDPNALITGSNNVMKKAPIFTNTYFTWRVGGFFERIIRTNVFFIVVFILFVGLKKAYFKISKR